MIDAMNPRIKDEIGHRYGELTVQERVANPIEGRAMWLCLCSCGAQCSVRGKDLRGGKTWACFRCAHVKHGHTSRLSGNSPEYQAWHNMIQRCDNSNVPHFDRYGGRGITVCAEWRESFESFFQDMGKRPSPKHSIDRIENNGNYEPTNCRWATKREQVTNMEKNVRLTIDGKTRILIEWLRYFSMDHKTYYKRVRNGHHPIDALTTPSHFRMRRTAALQYSTYGT